MNSLKVPKWVLPVLICLVIAIGAIASAATSREGLPLWRKTEPPAPAEPGSLSRESSPLPVSSVGRECPLEVEKEIGPVLLRIVEMGMTREETLYLHLLATNNGEQAFDLHQEECALPLLEDQAGETYSLRGVSAADPLRVDSHTTFAARWSFGPLSRSAQSLQLGINTPEGEIQTHSDFWTEPFGDKCLARLR